jgi:hypothetical protein
MNQRQHRGGPSSRLRRLALLVAIGTSVATTLTTATPAVPVARASSATTAYTAIDPVRVLDTRLNLGLSGRSSAGQTRTLKVGGVTPVPATATAVVLNLTIDDTGGPGFVTVWPTGVTQPTASSINSYIGGQTVANLVTVQLGTDGNLSIYTHMATNLVADVQGYYTPQVSAAAGRFVTTPITRIIDTRRTNTPLPAGGALDINVGTGSSIPNSASAAVLNVTVTETFGAGFFTVYPQGGTLPTVSNLNAGSAGATVANQVIVRLNAGLITVFSQRGGHVIVDVSGYYTGASAPNSTDGLFVPVVPGRLIDTRPIGLKPSPRRVLQATAAGTFGVPLVGVGAISANVTVDATSGPGFFTAWPARQYRPLASTVNATGVGQTIANHAIVQLSDGGVNLFTQSGGHIVVDVTGYFLGIGLPPTTPAAVPLRAPSGPAFNPNFSFFFPPPSPRTVWWPCLPIRYAINLNGYGEQYRAVIEDSLDRIASATGLRFADMGNTTFVPQNAQPITPILSHDLTITLASSAQSDLLSGSTIGLAYTVFTGQLDEILASSVVVDIEVATFPDWSSSGIGPVILHELGHSIGLDHVNDPNQLMYPFNGGVNTFGAGDLYGAYLAGTPGLNCPGFVAGSGASTSRPDRSEGIGVLHEGRVPAP